MEVGNKDLGKVLDLFTALESLTNTIDTQLQPDKLVRIKNRLSGL